MFRLLAFFVGFCSFLPLAQAQLTPYKLKDVELLDSPFKNAQELDKKYLLELDADRLLAPFLKNAGLTPKAENYGNWENTGLDGHTGGHYISALAMMKAATNDPQISQRFDYVLSELKRCQNAAGNGMITGVVNGRKVFEEISKGDIRANSFGLNGGWVPLYNQHKLFAGLRDGYAIGGSELSKEMFLKLCEWFYQVTKNLSDEQIQDMLRSEHGGLNEVFLDAYTFTSDKKFLDMAYKFSHQVLLKPLEEKEDRLTGMHANTQIPKVVGFAKIGIEDDNQDYLEASDYFWKEVVNKRSVAIGGNSVREHFHPDDDFSSMIISEQGPENCNTYNMLRLSKELYFKHPEPHFLNYYERALYNNILSSINPETGGFVYFNSMRPNHYRVYSSVQQDFWCCVGSGIENHGKYGEMIYAHEGNDVYVNLFIPSVLNAGNGITLTQKTDFPYATTTSLDVTGNGTFSIFLRKPEWLNAEKASIKVNGEKVAIQPNERDFFELKRSWKSGDVISYDMPFDITLDRLPDGSDWGAFRAGPIVLAASYEPQLGDRFYGDGTRMGHVTDGKLIPVYKAPVILDDNGQYTAHITQTDPSKLEYKLTGLSTGKSLTMRPYLDTHEKRYQVYFRLSDPVAFEKTRAIEQKEEEKLLALEKITADRVTPGEQQPESDHFFKEENSYRGVGENNYYRSTRGNISYELNADKKVKSLLIRMTDLIAGRSMLVYLNDQLLGEVSYSKEEPDTLHEVRFSIKGKLKKARHFTLRIEAKKPQHSPALADIRLLYE